MPCGCCGFEALTFAGQGRGAIAGSFPPGSPPRCERCGAARPDETAERYAEKLRLLARFGLASHTRLLLEPSPEDA